jgi:hypothetical protein
MRCKDIIIICYDKIFSDFVKIIYKLTVEHYVTAFFSRVHVDLCIVKHGNNQFTDEHNHINGVENF